MKGILLYSDQAAIFRHPNDRNITEAIGYKDFKYMPEWVADSYMYKALAAEGKAHIAESTEDKKRLENDGLKGQNAPKSEPKEIKTDGTMDNVLTNFAAKTVKELADICEKRGLEPKKGENKAYYLDLLAKAESK